MRKNLVPLARRPLLAYTIRAALASRRLSRVVLSSEDPEIRAVGKTLGVDVPFERPPELATDHAGTLEVVQHALGAVEALDGAQYDSVCVLQPTCPLRATSDIDGVVDMLAGSDSDSVITVCRVDEPHPMKMMLVEDGALKPLFPATWREGLRRQDLPPVFRLNGAVYCARRSTVVDSNSLWGSTTVAYEMPPERSINIDGPLDVALADLVLSAHPFPEEA